MPNIEYVSKGEGDIILFLHGWGQNKEMMLPLIEELKYKYKCIVIDMPGFGQSKFNNKNNLNDYTESIRGFLEEKNILPKHIVGHSFGGKVAFNYYLKYKDLNTITLIASPILKPTRNFKYYYSTCKYKIKKKLKLDVKNLGSEDYKNCSSNMKKLFCSVVNTHFDNKVSQLNVPTLLLWGDEDEKVPLLKAKKINRMIANSELIIEKGGHFAYLDNIDYTRLIIQKFLRRSSCD